MDANFSPSLTSWGAHVVPPSLTSWAPHVAPPSPISWTPQPCRTFAVSDGGSKIDARTETLRDCTGDTGRERDLRVRCEPLEGSGCDTGGSREFHAPIDFSNKYKQAECGPAQVWHVGVCRDSSISLVKGNALHRGMQWPLTRMHYRVTRYQLPQECSNSRRPHVLLVRASVLLQGRVNGCNRELETLVIDWPDGKWPVTPYAKFRHDLSRSIREAFYKRSKDDGRSGHGRFPLCSCSVRPGEHARGRIYHNIAGLKQVFPVCKSSSSSLCEDEWNNQIADLILSKVPSIYYPCFISPSIIHQYIRQSLDDLVINHQKLAKKQAPNKLVAGSSSTLQRPAGAQACILPPPRLPKAQLNGL